MNATANPAVSIALRPPGAGLPALERFGARTLPEASATVVTPYEVSCDAVVVAVPAASDLRAKARFAHPWSGPLDAAGWYALTRVHLKTHREQIKRILADQAGT